MLKFNSNDNLGQDRSFGRVDKKKYFLSWNVRYLYQDFKKNQADYFKNLIYFK